MPSLKLVGFLLAFLSASVAGASAQDVAAPLSAEDSAVLTSQERSDYDARLRAATTDQERARIASERDELVQVRIIQRQGVAVPPSPRELSQDPIMPDVPTPPLERSRPSGTTLPGGALSGTGAGTGPTINPGGR